MRSMVGVLTSPPNVDGRAGPASSIKTMRMFGASGGSRRSASRGWYTDSCMVRPAILPDGVDGNGSDSCFSSLFLTSDIEFSPGCARHNANENMDAHGFRISDSQGLVFATPRAETQSLRQARLLDGGTVTLLFHGRFR